MKILKNKSFWKIVICISLTLNLCSAIVLGPKVYQKVENLLTSYTGGGDLSNPQYNAYLTMFELNHSDAEVVFLGDSITARGRWEEFFLNKNLLNRGIGSDTSEGVLHRMDEIFVHHPSKIFLMIGINDIGEKTPTEEIIANVAEILEKTEEALPNCTVYLQSCLPVTTSPLEEIVSLNRGYQTLAQKYKQCVFINLYPLFLTANGTCNELLLSADGVHLNGADYQVWIEAIRQYVDEC